MIARLRRRRRWPPGVPDALWAPLTTAGLLVAIGLLGVAVDQPWLFPGLGPVAFLMAEYADSRAARFSQVVAGHAIGLAAGLTAVTLLGLRVSSLPTTTGHLSLPRVWASAVAVGLTILAEIALRVSHPPAAATTLLVALGAVRPDWHGIATVAGGVLLVATLGEVIRRLRLGRGLPGLGPGRRAAAPERLTPPPGGTKIGAGGGEAAPRRDQPGGEG